MGAVDLTENDFVDNVPVAVDVESGVNESSVDVPRDLRLGSSYNTKGQP